MPVHGLPNPLGNLGITGTPTILGGPEVFKNPIVSVQRCGPQANKLADLRIPGCNPKSFF